MNLFCDIESIPGEAMPDVTEIKVPANYKDPVKIAEYQKANQEDQYKAQALDSMKGRIICVGYAVEECGVMVITGDEIDTLNNLNVALQSHMSYNESFTWIGWNIETFDIPWLWRKAIPDVASK